MAPGFSVEVRIRQQHYDSGNSSFVVLSCGIALVLLGLSSSIYFVVRGHLSHEVTERLDGALDALTAAVEFEPTGLDWESHKRRMTFAEDQSEGPIVWGVFDDHGQYVDGSVDSADLLSKQIQSNTPNANGQHDVHWQDKTWRLDQRILRWDAGDTGRVASKSKDHEDSRQRYAALALVVGAPVDAIFRSLQTVATALVGLSLAIWISAALVGRWLCKKALIPVTRMAQTVRVISADDLTQRLPISKTGDELEDLGHAFNDLLTRLQTSFQRQQQFTGQASHQLRTPLTAILGQIDVALRRDRQPEEYRRALELTRQQATQLRQIVEMLLFLSREDADAAPPVLEPLELHEWLTEHLRAWEHHPRYSDFQIDMAPNGEHWANAHDGLLAQAVNNLLENACKYSVPGSAIILQTGANEKQAWLAVEDRGYGISAEELANIFEPFFRGADAQRRGISGTGLGLAVVDRIVAAMDGRMEVSSQPGKGTRFTLILSHAPAPIRVEANC